MSKSNGERCFVIFVVIIMVIQSKIFQSQHDPFCQHSSFLQLSIVTFIISCRTKRRSIWKNCKYCLPELSIDYRSYTCQHHSWSWMQPNVSERRQERIHVSIVRVCVEPNWIDGLYRVQGYWWATTTVTSIPKRNTTTIIITRRTTTTKNTIVDDNQVLLKLLVVATCFAGNLKVLVFCLFKWIVIELFLVCISRI